MTAQTSRAIAVIGGGPAGLMAAQAAIDAGVSVDLYEAKGSVGRKFLIAGKGGLNLTHSDPFARFVSRYGEGAERVEPWLRDFDATALREFARGLGVETFVGSSGRVFPSDLKAAPFLRRWVHRLREAGARFHVQHRWRGWAADGALRFDTPRGEVTTYAAATVLALGGGSWPQLGSDGAWIDLLAARGIAIAPLQPSNCGFDVAWSAHFIERHAGAAIKPVIATIAGDHADDAMQGECVVSANGIEGQLIYALSARLRDTIAREGSAVLHLDLAPGLSLARVRAELARPREQRSRSEHWRRRLKLQGVKAGLVLEHLAPELRDDPDAVAAAIKALPLRLLRPRPLAEAISTGGGVRWSALDDELMLRPCPGVFCAGEMIDWEAPTGGYLLTACFASGLRAGRAAAARAKAG